MSAIYLGTHFDSRKDLRKPEIKGQIKVNLMDQYFLNIIDCDCLFADKINTFIIVYNIVTVVTVYLSDRRPTLVAWYRSVESGHPLFKLLIWSPLNGLLSTTFLSYFSQMVKLPNLVNSLFSSTPKVMKFFWRKCCCCCSSLSLIFSSRSIFRKLGRALS